MPIQEPERSTRITDDTGEPIYRLEYDPKSGGVRIYHERLVWTPPAVDPMELGDAALKAAGREVLPLDDFRVVDAAVKAAFPGLPNGMTEEQVRRRVYAALLAAQGTGARILSHKDAMPHVNALRDLLALILDDMSGATNRDLACDGDVGDEEGEVWQRIERKAREIRNTLYGTERNPAQTEMEES